MYQSETDARANKSPFPALTMRHKPAPERDCYRRLYVVGNGVSCYIPATQKARRLTAPDLFLSFPKSPGKSHTFLQMKLYGISLAPRVRDSGIHFLLLCLAVLEELLCHLREQGVGQHILILLFPLSALFLKLRQLRLD